MEADINQTMMISVVPQQRLATSLLSRCGLFSFGTMYAIKVVWVKKL
jgi:hypothetical protein